MIAQAGPTSGSASNREPKPKRETPKPESSASSIDKPQDQSLESRKARMELAKKWRERLESKTVTEATIEVTVADLVKSKQYEEVIACLEQAITLGKIIQPWMHEALALAMQSAGRPAKDIERVLMSNQDLMGGDYDSVMRLAAYLTRFERNDRAIELYRQASHLNPGKMEPFLRALELIQRGGNLEAAVWCAPEVLAYAWGPDREPLRRAAEQAASDAIPKLMDSGKISKALQLQEAMLKAKQVDLIVRLDWNGQGDVDLLVEEPAGSVCSMSTPFTPSGGAFVHDGFGPNQSNCYDEYICSMAMTGEYRLRIRHIRGDIVGKRARLTITRGQNMPHQEVETQTVVLSRTDVIVKISVMNGRRALADAVIPEAKKAGRRGLAGAAVLSQIGGNPVGNVAPFGGGGAAVGYQPVITMISEGISMNAMATVSGDRRYVRLSVVPQFNTITDVFTFSFVH